MLYPEIEPFAQGMLDVGNDNSIYWERSGNPAGYPALVIHGGPGSGSSAASRRFFDPERYDIILFDQRNCGRSTPHASDPAIDLAGNTLSHLVADIERLRLYLGVQTWLLFGTSWGSTLALVYAERYPAHISAVILAGVTMTRRLEIDWLYRGMAPLFPVEWARFRAGIPIDQPDGDLVSAYGDLLSNPDPSVHMKAAKDWHDWEAAPILLSGNSSLPRRWSDPNYLLARARIITHYFRHAAWLSENEILDNANRLSGIPGILIQGRLDLEAPLVTALEMSLAWPDAALVIVEQAAHSPLNRDMSAEIVAATQKFLATLKK